MQEKSIQAKVIELLDKQEAGWPLLKENLDGLNSVRLRKFQFKGYSFIAQFNPKRIRSSAARVDSVSIKSRQCFLCDENRPSEQLGIELENGYKVLCNPYPIFRQHFTIVKNEHVLQLIKDEFGNFLRISRMLPDLAVFYNGPKCGASAPDHMHFQAGNKGLMPVETEINSLLSGFGELVISGDSTRVYTVDDQIRRFVYIESDSEEDIGGIFSAIYDKAGTFKDGDEPMMNLLSYYEDGWKLYIFLRSEHRPRQYFLEGQDQYVFSPASVDLGGTLIFPVEDDFQKINHADIEDMMSQVALSRDEFTVIRNMLKKYLL